MWQLILLIGAVFIIAQVFKLDFRKTLAVTGIAIVLGIAGFFYWLNEKSKVDRCEGYEGKIGIEGKWQTNDYFISFNGGNVIVEMHKGGQAKGTFTVSGNVVTTSISYGEIGRTYYEEQPYVIKVCDISDKDLIFRELNGTGYNEDAKLISK